MYSEPVFNIVYQKLPAELIDRLRLGSSDLRDHIDQCRMDFPRTKVHQIKILNYSSWYCLNCETTEFIDNPKVKTFGPNSRSIALKTNEVPPNKLMNYLRHIAPKKLILSDEQLCCYLSKKWVEKIEEITILNIINVEKFMKFIDDSKYSQLAIECPLEENTWKRILEELPNVKELKLNLKDGSADVFEILTEKSKDGTGIKSLEIRNSSEYRIYPDDVIKFFKFGKFEKEAKVKIFHVSEIFRGYIEEKFNTINEIPGFSFSTDLHLVKTPDSNISFIYNTIV